MRTADFDYDLPPEAIAQTPMEPRDAARLLIVDRGRETFDHAYVRDLPDLLRPGDAVVVNDSRVIPARLFGQRRTGGRVELLLLRREGNAWQALARPARRLAVGETIDLDGGTAEIVGVGQGGLRSVRLSNEAAALASGAPPLPPYITTPLADPDRYQTVYARDPGSAAAPTAGLHLTGDLIGRLRDRGIGVHAVTLHVGLDTFRPVAEDDPTTHVLHGEWCSVTADTAEALNTARASGGRIVAIGTTATRTLETATGADGIVRSHEGVTYRYILPGDQFHAVDVLLTNFHLPKSTLLMLVSAFASRERILRAYQTALASGYRFYSFGDAMLIV